MSTKTLVRVLSTLIAFLILSGVIAPQNFQILAINSAYPEEATINAVTANRTYLVHKGGNVVLKVHGENLECDILLSAVDLSTQTWIESTRVSNETFLFIFPQNESQETDVLYTVYASIDNGATWLHYGQLVTVTVSRIAEIIDVSAIIADFQGTKTVDSPINLSATIEPSNASYHSVEWSIQDVGTTGAELKGGMLKTTSEGEVILQATISEGKTNASEDFFESFTITVKNYEQSTPSDFSLEYSENLDKTSYTVTIPALEGAEYSFDGITYSSLNVKTDCSPSTTITGYVRYAAKADYNASPAAVSSVTLPVIVRPATPTPIPAATPTPWTEYPTTAPTPSQPFDPVLNYVTSPSTVMSDNGEAVAILSQKQVSDAISAAHTAKNEGRSVILSIDIGLSEEAHVKSLNLPFEMLTLATETSAKLVINSGQLGCITFDSAAVRALGQRADGTEIVIKSSLVDNQSLSKEMSGLVGQHHVYDFSVTAGGECVSDFAGGNATISVPYVLGENENKDMIFAYYITDSGELVAMNSKYDEEKQQLFFATGHFSKYVIGKNYKSFEDALLFGDYATAIEYITMRQITSGVDGDNYSAATDCSRAMFLVMLMRAYNIPKDLEWESNFSDAGNAYYSGYLAAAKRLGIAAGIGENRFAPKQTITVQEMYVFIYNVKCFLGQAQGDTVISEENYNLLEMGNIAFWAANAVHLLTTMEITPIKDKLINPTYNMTRGDTAQALYEVLSSDTLNNAIQSG